MTHLGATPHRDGTTTFLLWAPRPDRVELVLGDGRVVTMEPTGDRGYLAATVPDAPAGTRYRYRLHRDGEVAERPDPASRWQPDGLHGPSAVFDPTAHAWTDEAWENPPLHEHVLYELHVGTFTEARTFDGVIGRLGHLRDLGITAIELMPVAQFPGERNWGYDGVLPYAVQDSYGGPHGLQQLVDAAHASGIAVFLDVVYNHVGPEGNHLRDFAPYFTDKHATPWGDAVNVDDAGADEVRRYLVDNAVRWVTEFHLDGLRLDAVHAIRDQSAVHLLEELAQAVHTAGAHAGRRVHVIGESDLEDPRLVRPVEEGGFALDAQWLDDVHHAVHVALTGEQDGYYVDYEGLGDLVRCLEDRYAFAGRYSAYRDRTVGRPAPDVPYDRFVVCAQNHDQVGNRMLGNRLSELMDREGLKTAAATVLLSPFVPMLWMGEEYGETAPFLYFVSHTEPALIEAVRAGRAEEFAAFDWQEDAVPDPQAVDTFERSTLDWSTAGEGWHATLLALYRELIGLRRELPAIADPTVGDARPVPVGSDLLAWWRGAGADLVGVVVNTSDGEGVLQMAMPGACVVRLDTADERWGGPGSGPGAGAPVWEELRLAPRSVAVLVASDARRSGPQDASDTSGLVPPSGETEER
ncbi:MAG: malto-oligosyltrehalose trehalohydrolase [Nitriliruptorales bacterium]|nr:malto-oligosyltrehalose trehalohydrolase [Nitriliruptorales bacterium]